MNKTIEIFNKQVDVFRELIEEVENSLKVFEAMDGKMINVRLERALKENIKNAQNKPNDKQISLSLQESYGKKIIRFYNHDRSIMVTDRWNRTHWEYVEREDISIQLQDTEHEKKIDFSVIKEKVQDAINYNMKRIAEIENTLEHYEDMIKEYKEINKRIADFQNEYDYSIRSHADCNQFKGY